MGYFDNDCQKPPISDRGVTFFYLWGKLPIPWSCCDVTERQEEIDLYKANPYILPESEETIRVAERVLQTIPMSIPCEICIDYWYNKGAH